MLSEIDYGFKYFVQKTVVTVIIFQLLVVSPLVAIQCFRCSDLMLQVSRPNFSAIFTMHKDGCGKMEKIQRVDCPDIKACIKLTSHYYHQSTTEIRPVVLRSCWDPTEEGVRNYTIGQCFFDSTINRPHQVEICLCEGNFCNKSTSILQQSGLQIFIIAINFVVINF